MGEILSSGPDRPRWTPPRWMIAAGATVGAVAVLTAGIVAVSGPDKPHRAASAPASSSPHPSGIVFPDGPDATVAPGETPGMVIKWAALDGDSAWDQRDLASGSGPWTVTVRRHDGSVGINSAVVTFPVPAPGKGRAVKIGGASGTAGDGEITWRIGGAYARVRGDLPEPELVAIAAATTVTAGRPAVEPPAGLSVTATAPSRPRDLREVRYLSAAAGEAAALSEGVTFTGVVRCGGFEDRLYAAKARAAGTVHGKPAVVTSALEGDGLLAWEPTPGVVAYVGYSGAPFTDAAVAALHRIAERTRLLNPQQWQTTGAQTTNGVNDFG
jgi:hypothetical protein